MFHETFYAEEKMRQAREARIEGEVRRRAADPRAEIPRTGVGLVHEMFRRIAEGERPAARPQHKRLLAWR